LDLIKWKDENGVERELRIYSKIGHKWEDIATRLCLEKGEISMIKQDSHYQTYPCIKAVFKKWFENATYLPNARDYPKSWQGLITLLNDVELGEVAKELERALSSQINSVRGNFS
jgi:maltose-binding protein MalE